MFPVDFVIALSMRINEVLLFRSDRVKSGKLDLHVAGVIRELDVRLHKCDIVRSEDATVSCTIQVVEVGVVGESQVAHLLATSLHGTEWAIDVSVHATAKDTMDRNIRRGAVPLEVWGDPVWSLGASTYQPVGMSTSVVP